MTTDKPEYPPLLPPGFHKMDLVALRQLCVEHAHFITSSTRPRIMNGLIGVMRKLHAANVSGDLWVDGGFVTENIDPEDVDILIHIPSSRYEFDFRCREAVDWASSPDRLGSHLCDAYRWIEYTKDHPLHAQSEQDRRYWSQWFGFCRPPVRRAKGIVVIDLPGEIP